MDSVKELAWPVALILVSLFVYLTILRLTKKGTPLKLKFRDWFEVNQGELSAPAAQPEFQPTPSADETPAEAIPEASAAPPTNDDKKATFFTLAKTVDEVDALFDEFKKETAYAQNREFWETYYVTHRASVCKTDEQAALEALARANPTWVWPLADLYHRHMRFHEFDEAGAVLEQALARDNPEQHGHALRLAVDYRFQTKGMDAALNFIRENLAERLTDHDAAVLLSAIADLARDDKDVFSAAVPREMAFLRDSGRNSEVFDLAYALAETHRYKTRAYALYQRLFWDEERPHVRNNMGVIIGDVDVTNQRDLYEDSAAKGSTVAISNLVNGLVSGGFIKRAEVFLSESGKANETQDPHIVSALETIARAKKQATERKQEFDKRINSEDRQYREALTSAFNSFMRSGFSIPDGTYAGPQATITFSGAAAQAEVTDGTSTFLGSLTKKALCYEGLLEERGATILTSQLRGGLVLQVGERELKLIVWPQEVAASPKYITLTPVPAPPDSREMNDDVTPPPS